MPDNQETSVNAYLRALFSDMLARMSGPLSVPFAVLAIWLPNLTQKALFTCLAVAGALVASYRVWRLERLSTISVIKSKEGELGALRHELVAFQSQVDISVTTEGNPGSQMLRVTASTNDIVRINRIEYMTSSETCVASEEVCVNGLVPVDHQHLTELWNAPRQDMRQFDLSGPAKIGLYVSVKNKSLHLILPVNMDNVADTTRAPAVYMLRRITGSKKFINL